MLQNWWDKGCPTLKIKSSILSITTGRFNDLRKLLASVVFPQMILPEATVLKGLKIFATPFLNNSPYV
jgi:hypothetical protein